MTNSAKELLDKVFPKGRTQRKTNIVSFYMSNDELERLAQRAEQASVSMGAFARTATEHLLEELDARDGGVLTEDKATNIVEQLSEVVLKTLSVEDQQREIRKKYKYGEFTPKTEEVVPNLPTTPTQERE